MAFTPLAIKLCVFYCQRDPQMAETKKRKGKFKQMDCWIYNRFSYTKDVEYTHCSAAQWHSKMVLTLKYALY